MRSATESCSGPRRFLDRTHVKGEDLGLDPDYLQNLQETYEGTPLYNAEMAITAEQSGAPESDVKPLYVAIVDDIDTDAVLDLVSLVPPQKGAQGDVSAWKRAQGQWVAAPEILSALRSSTPPSVVELSDEAVLKEVIGQVDKSTSEEGQPEPAPGETPVAEDGTPEPAAAPVPDKGPAPVQTSNFAKGGVITEDPDESPIVASLSDGEYIITADAWRSQRSKSQIPAPFKSLIPW